jgi:hypothetical protein
MWRWMRHFSIYTAGKRLLFSALIFLSLIIPYFTKAGGVTIITHGFELPASYPTWITAMANDIPNYFHARYPGLDTNFSTYKLIITNIGGTYYYYPPTRTNGSLPSATQSGEIIVELDWSSLSGDLTDSYASTSNVAYAVSQVLMATNSFPELNGHPAIELPIHLVGHSRGGSLMSQISYDLGTNGIWTDHLTTLDPYPLNNDGNFDFPAVEIDASAKNTYSTVLFADNYWQDIGLGWLVGDPDGESVNGAYVRQLSSLSGGYGNDHSNVHLWYYGTIDLDTPANDTGATITSTERADWWVPYEDDGLVAGFYYSLIGGGNRLSTDTPLGMPSDPAIVNGFNQYWNLGAGTTINRTALSSNSGAWPSIIKFNVTGTNVVTQSNLVVTTLYYQYGGSSNLTAEIYFDQDLNPYNSNGIPVLSLQPPASGTGSVFYYSSLGLPTTNVAPGVYAVYAKISDGLRTRYLYTPELVQIVSPLQPPILAILKLNSTQFRVSVNGVSGQTIALQNSADLHVWVPFVTNKLTGTNWTYTNNVPPNSARQFYRAVLQ